MFMFFFFKRKTAYEITVRDWSSDVCSSDLAPSVWSIETPSQRRSTGECPTPATATLPRCSHTPSPSLSRRHWYRSGAVMAPPFLYRHISSGPGLTWLDPGMTRLGKWFNLRRRRVSSWFERFHDRLSMCHDVAVEPTPRPEPFPVAGGMKCHFVASDRFGEASNLVSVPHKVIRRNGMTVPRCGFRE